MTLGKLLANTKIQIDTPEKEITGLTSDSRKVEKNYLFVALSPDKSERRAHIKESIAKGASAVLCPMSDVDLGGELLYSVHCRRDYGLIAANWFGEPAKGLCLIGVTGTNGKTTTTHLIKGMLENGWGSRVGLIGTNEILVGEESYPATHTTPDAYHLQEMLRIMADQGCTYVVMEVSSHGLSQYRTVGLRFAVGIFTNLTQDHLDYHKTMTAYQEAKEKLFLQSTLSVFNLDDPTGRIFAETHSGLTYSENKEGATVRAEEVTLLANRVDFVAVVEERKSPVSLPIFGGFNLYNALAAITCAVALGMELSTATTALGSVSGVKGRAELLETSHNCTVMIDYAHTPDALENILTMVRGFTKGRLICVFGCGGNRDKTKRPLMGAIAEDLADIMVVTSDNPRGESPTEIISDICDGLGVNPCKLHIQPDRAKAIYWAIAEGKEGDVVVLAGKGHECYQEIAGQKLPMDEREIVRDYARY
ncbi:MAG: UDP-N-acetylmuramoyl-L-alanyl-D-glutamate--2,6-diaminopimelate ligase [Eubacteriales bacterium]